MPDEASIRQELQALLRYANKTAVAEQLGVSAQAVINWAEGRYPSQRRLREVRALFGIAAGTTQETAPPEWVGRLEIRLGRVEEIVERLPDQAYADKVGAEAAAQVIEALRGDDGLEKLTRELTKTVLEAVQKLPPQKSVVPSRARRRPKTGTRHG